jgi:hypothetical protein
MVLTSLAGGHVGFHKPIMVIEIDVWTPALIIKTHASKRNCDKAYIHGWYSPSAFSAAKTFLSKKKVLIWAKGSKMEDCAKNKPAPNKI